MNAAARAAAGTVLAPVLRRGGRAYLTGVSRQSAISVAHGLLARGYGVTLAYWHAEADGAGAVLVENIALLTALALRGAAQIAVKAPGLAFDREGVAQLAQSSAGAGVPLVFDAHGPADADATFALARAAKAEGADVGVAVASRWAGAVRDAGGAASAGLDVRVIKGQWPDDRSVGPRSEAGFRASFGAVVEELAGASVRVMVATHDPVLLDSAVGRLRAAGTPCEIELLLGLPARRALAVAAHHGVPVRFYLPYGHPSLVYSPSSILRRPRLAVPLAQGVLLGGRNQQVRQREALRAAGRAGRAEPPPTER